MKTATPTAATRSEADPIAYAVNRAQQADLTVTVEDKDALTTITIGCPDCANSLAFTKHHWQPASAARTIDLFICAHQDRR